MDPGEQADEIVLPAQREHRIDQVVADTGFALLDLEAVGEEIEQIAMIKRQSQTVVGDCADDAERGAP